MRLCIHFNWLHFNGAAWNSIILNVPAAMLSLLSFMYFPATSGKTLSATLVMSKVHRKWKCNCQLLHRQAENNFSCTTIYWEHMQASGWGQHLKKHLLNVKIFFPGPDSLLPWQQQRIRRKWSWACCGNKQALSLTVSRVLLLPSLCSPYLLPPPPLTSLPSFNIRLLFSRFFVQLESTHPCHQRDSPFNFI